MIMIMIMIMIRNLLFASSSFFSSFFLLFFFFASCMGWRERMEGRVYEAAGIDRDDC